MKKNQRYIDDAFSRLRQTEPVVSFNQMRALVEDITPEPQQTDIKGKIAMISTIALFCTALSFLTFSSLSEPREQTAPDPARPAATLQSRSPQGVIDNVASAVSRVEEKGTESLLHAAPVNSDQNEGLNALPGTVDRIDGIATLELDTMTLGRLGIMPDTDGVRIFQRGSNGMTSGMFLHIGGTTFNPVVIGGYPPYVTPIDEETIRIRFVTSDEGLERLAIYDDSDTSYRVREARIAALIDSAERDLVDQKILEDRMKQIYADESSRLAKERRSGRYVPVLVHAASVSRKEDADSEGEWSWSPHVIVWFDPTPRFLALLPEESRTRVENQLRWSTLLEEKRIDETLDAFIERREGEGEALPSGISADAVSGDLIGVTGEASGAITMVGISPNPARTSAEVHYALATPRNVTITLHDLQGKHVRTFRDSSPSTAKINIASIDLNGITPGIYLLAITTAKERVVQRLVVSR